MEQYVHLLIARDSEFVPKSLQLAGFFETLIGTFGFEVVSGQRFQPGIRMVKPSGRFRRITNPITEETLSIAISDYIQIDAPADIPAIVDHSGDFRILASGAWPAGRPFALFTPDGTAFDQPLNCEAGCHVRLQPVSTSWWNNFAFPAALIRPPFGAPCDAGDATGVFFHPQTGQPILVPDGACARFWIEFEFGKFLTPRITDSLNLFPPYLVEKISACFGTQLVQGCRMQ